MKITAIVLAILSSVTAQQEFYMVAGISVRQNVRESTPVNPLDRWFKFRRYQYLHALTIEISLKDDGEKSLNANLTEIGTLEPERENTIFDRAIVFHDSSILEATKSGPVPQGYHETSVACGYLSVAPVEFGSGN